MSTICEPDRCRAMVYKRDCYRRTGRGKSGFSLHYNRERCTRKAGDDGRCWQHKDCQWFADYPYL